MIDTVKMSSKGQIVIPQNIRKTTHSSEGSIFAVVGNKDTIILKKIQAPSKEEILKRLDTMAKDGRKNAEKSGIKETDVQDLIHKDRGVK
ncbi:AbrB/MazE/SpoVT family DNA-binding domain-containing protein [Candidatus Woesearchaeota archaeon]|nr:AbrB/MazE/SpoVT family DNA-binding domain-containing protein [Candidatus Woesearchaeota archaeon]